MKAVIVTQEEPFYLSLFMGTVLSQFKEVIAIILLPGIPKGFTPISYIKRLYDIFGLRAFLTYGVLFVYHRLFAVPSRWLKFRRFYSVKSAARRNSVPVYKLNDINSRESLNFLKYLAPDIIISVAAPQIFRKELINLTRYTINIHAALLPEHKGMMPSFWVLAEGEEKTGITVHYVNEYIDKGEIILQKTIDITPQDTLHSLQSRVAKIGAVALLGALTKIEKGDVTGVNPRGAGSYNTFPTREDAKMFRARGRRFI
ncbi:methionyl-tRNA formyltransferase [Chloroflexota bacterium]